MKSKRFLILAAVLVVAFGLLLWKAFGMFGDYSVTVSQFWSMQSALGKEVSAAVAVPASYGTTNVTVHGWVGKEKSEGQSLTITDGKTTLPVSYKGTIPPSLTAGSEIVLQGKLENGRFNANSLRTTKTYRVEGPLAPGVEVTYDVTTRTTRFTITDKEADSGGAPKFLPVVYTGALPDTFFVDVKRVDVSLVVIGKQGPDGAFVATQIQTKCASKYEAPTPTLTPAAGA